MKMPQTFEDLEEATFTEIEGLDRSTLGWILYLIIEAIKELRERKEPRTTRE